MMLAGERPMGPTQLIFARGSSSQGRGTWLFVILQLLSHGSQLSTHGSWPESNVSHLGKRTPLFLGG